MVDVGGGGGGGRGGKRRVRGARCDDDGEEDRCLGIEAQVA